MGANLASVRLPTGIVPKYVGTSEFFACILSTTNVVYCWGRLLSGWLGTGTGGTSIDGNGNVGDSATEMGDALNPVLLGSITVKELWVGGQFSCVLSTVNSVKCWGAGSHLSDMLEPLLVAGTACWTAVGGERGGLGEREGRVLFAGNRGLLRALARGAGSAGAFAQDTSVRICARYVGASKMLQLREPCWWRCPVISSAPDKPLH
jgi:hypothetical protein